MADITIVISGRHPAAAEEVTDPRPTLSVDPKPSGSGSAPETVRDRFQRLVRRAMVVTRLMPKDNSQASQAPVRSVMHDMDASKSDLSQYASLYDQAAREFEYGCLYDQAAEEFKADELEKSKPNVQLPGSPAAEIPPINGSQPFATFWQDIKSDHTYGDTVSHRLVSKQGGPEGESWHLKTPGKEASTERFKRFLQKMIYWITGKPYKSNYFDDNRLVAQREVLAANVYKAAMKTSPDSPPQQSNTMRSFDDDYQVGYSFDPGDSDHKASHSIAARHLDGYEDASELVSRPALPTLDDYEENFDPVTNLVIRRFLLGDEDCLKPENYMFSKKEGTEGKDGRERVQLCAIDFGMGFYNCFDLPNDCSLETFQKRLLTPSRKHAIQYRGKPTLLTLLKDEDGQRVQGLIKKALEKIASMDDQTLSTLAGHIHDPKVREGMLEILRFKVQQANAIVSGNGWPVCPGPVSLGRKIMNSIRTRRHKI